MSVNGLTFIFPLSGSCLTSEAYELTLLCSSLSTARNKMSTVRRLPPSATSPRVNELSKKQEDQRFPFSSLTKCWSVQSCACLMCCSVNSSLCYFVFRDTALVIFINISFLYQLSSEWPVLNVCFHNFEFDLSLKKYFCLSDWLCGVLKQHFERWGHWREGPKYCTLFNTYYHNKRPFSQET